MMCGIRIGEGRPKNTGTPEGLFRGSVWWQVQAVVAVMQHEAASSDGVNVERCIYKWRRLGCRC